MLNAAWHDAIHHQPVPETALRGAQNALAQDAAMGEHEGKAGVVADGADIAEMVGEALELRHQSAQPNRARRNFDFERRLDRAREGEAIGDRAVAGCPRQRGTRPCSTEAPRHQRFDPLMGVAQTLLQPDHGLAVCGKAEMARFDDPGMHGTDRDLVQAFAFRRTEMHRARRSPLRLGSFPPKGGAAPIGHGRARAASRADPHGLEAKEIPERAFKPDRGRMQPSDGWKTPIGALNGRHDRSAVLALVEDGHVDRRHLSPKAEQGPAALGQPRRQELPEIIVHDDPRARPMPFDPSPIGDQLGYRRHALASPFTLTSTAIGVLC